MLTEVCQEALQSEIDKLCVRRLGNIEVSAALSHPSSNLPLSFQMQNICSLMQNNCFTGAQIYLQPNPEFWDNLTPSDRDSYGMAILRTIQKAALLKGDTVHSNGAVKTKIALHAPVHLSYFHFLDEIV